MVLSGSPGYPVVLSKSSYLVVITSTTPLPPRLQILPTHTLCSPMHLFLPCSESVIHIKSNTNLLSIIKTINELLFLTSQSLWMQTPMKVLSYLRRRNRCLGVTWVTLWSPSLSGELYFEKELCSGGNLGHPVV